MRRVPRKAIAALAAAGFMFTPGAVAAGPAPGGSTATNWTGNWNCRQVIANDITYFALSYDSHQTYPYTLKYGHRFKSYGVVNGRFRATTAGPTHWGHDGYTTSDSRWVTQIPDHYCY